MVFEDIRPRLWDVMWNGFGWKLDDVMNVLFLVYYAQYQPEALKEWLLARKNDLNS